MAAVTITSSKLPLELEPDVVPLYCEKRRHKAVPLRVCFWLDEAHASAVTLVDNVHLLRVGVTKEVDCTKENSNQKRGIGQCQAHQFLLTRSAMSELEYAPF